MWSLYFLVRVVDTFPRPKITQVILLGIFVGFSLGVRIAGLLIICYFGMASLLFVVCRIRDRKNPKEALISIAWRGILSGIVAYLSVLPFWPVLWKSPFDRVKDSLAYAQSFDWNGFVLYDGEFIRASELPCHYLPNWLSITLPEWTLASAILGIIIVGMILLRSINGGTDEKHTLAWLCIYLAVLLPVAYVVLRKPIIYDGMRHFLFVLPPLILLATKGIVCMREFLRNRYSGVRHIMNLPIAVTVIFSGLLVLFSYTTLHPFYYVYFNGWVGGLSGADQKYETDYWGLSYREAMEGLGSYLEENP